MVSDDDAVKKKKRRRERSKTEVDDGGNESDGGYSSAGSESTSSSDSGEGHVLRESSCFGLVTKDRIPYVIFMCDFLIQLGSGMTVKFFPLYFINIVKLDPASVQCIYVVQPLLQAATTVLLQNLSVWTGRVQIVLASRVVGVTCLLAMAYLELAYRDKGGWEVSWQLLVALYILRTIGMNATSPLEESLMMDYCPSDQRARWKALESINELNWCGSAAIGGLLADRFGYASTFLFTAGMQFLGGSIYVLLLPMIPVESALAAGHEVPSDDAEEGAAAPGRGQSLSQRLLA